MKHKLYMIFTGFMVVICCPSLLAAPQVKNREPKPDEIGYRPADGASVRLNPPSWIWLHEPDAKTYAIQWARTKDFSDAQSAEGFQWNTYTHSQPIEAGTWYWRYRFTDKKGEISNWSQARSTAVPADATAFPMPTRTEQKARMPQGHPRLFLRPEDLPKLRELAKGREADRFRMLRDEADRLIRVGPTPEPEHRGSARNKEDAEAVKYWWPNRTQTEKACIEAETLAFVYLITQEDRYGEAARKWVLHLASWDPDGPTNFSLNCEAGKPMLHRPSRAYDWAWDRFTPAERQKIQAVTLRRLTDAWRSGEVGEGTGHLNRPFSSHGNRVWHKAAEAGIVFHDEIPEAPVWLDYAVNKFLFKSSPFGTQSHGHNPHNTYQLNGYGEALLTTCVYRDLHGSKFHYDWAHSTVAHNGVLVNGEGQTKHTAAPDGRIVAEDLRPEYDYIVGDATAAYGGRLTRFRRHVAFVKGAHPFIVIYDDLAAKEPATFQWMLHALKPFNIDEKTNHVTVDQPKAGVAVKYLTSVPLAYRQWDGFTPPPTKEFPNQWHVEASTSEKREEIGLFSVLVPYRAGQAVPWQAVRLESAESPGVRVTLGRRTTQVVFSSPNAAKLTVKITPES